MSKQRMTEDASPNVGDVERTLKALEGDDRLGTAGEVAGVTGGAAAGAAAAGAVAGAFSATTLLGSSTLASVLGGVFVTTTPIGWVVGCAAVGGVAAYALVKVVRSGGRQDEKRRRLYKAIKSRCAANQSPEGTDIVDAFEKAIEDAMSRGVLSAPDAERMKLLVSQGHLPMRVALNRLNLVGRAHAAGSASKA